MKKISSSIPTIIQNPNVITKGKIKEKDLALGVIVFQHNNLVEAKYSLTLQEKRIILWLISRIKPEDEDFKEHVLSVKEFMELLELTGKGNYKELQKITLGLMKKVLVIKQPDKHRITQVAWLNSAIYEEKEGLIKLSFSSKMKPFLLCLKKAFTAISMSDLMQFSSIHAIRIYELLKQYEGIGERTMTIDDIKEHCGVKGKLKQYVEFKNKILLIAQREINQKSDIKFEFEPIKHVRKFVAIKFNITKNIAYERRKNPDLAVEYKDPKRKPPVFDILREFGFSIATVNKLIKENTEEVIKNAIDAVDLQIAKGNVRNTKAMIRTAIKEKWNPDRYIAR